MTEPSVCTWLALVNPQPPTPALRKVSQDKEKMWSKVHVEASGASEKSIKTSSGVRVSGKRVQDLRHSGAATLTASSQVRTIGDDSATSIFLVNESCAKLPIPGWERMVTLIESVVESKMPPSASVTNVGPAEISAGASSVGCFGVNKSPHVAKSVCARRRASTSGAEMATQTANKSPRSVRSRCWLCCRREDVSRSELL